MAIAVRTVGNHRSNKDQISTEDFRKWLMSFDTNKDGRISQDELRQAIRSRGLWFSGWRCGRGMKDADADGSGFIDEDEIDHLLEFAEKSLGFKFVE